MGRHSNETKRAVVRAVLDGMPQREAADAHDIPTGTISAWLSEVNHGNAAWWPGDDDVDAAERELSDALASGDGELDHVSAGKLLSRALDRLERAQKTYERVEAEYERKLVALDKQRDEARDSLKEAKALYEEAALAQADAIRMARSVSRKS